MRTLVLIIITLLLIAPGEDPGGTLGLGNGEPWGDPHIPTNTFHIQTIHGEGIATRIECCNSMAPYITGDDLVLAVVRTRGKRYQIGDVISFVQSDCSATHRIISVNALGYVTKGDNRPYTDRCIVRFSSVQYHVIGVVKDFYSLGDHSAS